MSKYLTEEDLNKLNVPIEIQETIKNILTNIQNLNKSGFSNMEAVEIIKRGKSYESTKKIY